MTRVVVWFGGVSSSGGGRIWRALLVGVCRQKESGRKVCRVFQGRNSSRSVVFSLCMFWREKIGGNTAVSCVERSEWMPWRLLVWKRNQIWTRMRRFSCRPQATVLLYPTTSRRSGGHLWKPILLSGKFGWVRGLPVLMMSKSNLRKTLKSLPILKSFWSIRISCT